MRWNVMIEMVTLLLVFGDLYILTRPYSKLSAVELLEAVCRRIAEMFSFFSYCRGLQL